MLKALLVLLVVAIVVVAARIVTGEPVSYVLRRRVAPLWCALVGHRRDRASVRRTADGYQARCRRCEARLHKAGREAAWIEVGRPPIGGSAGEHGSGVEVVHAGAVDTGEERSA